MKKIDIVYFDAGSGHRSAALALESALVRLHKQWQVRSLNIVDVFAHHKRFSWIVRTGIDYFNWQLRRNKVFDLKGLINLSLLFHDLLSPRDIEQIAHFWQDSSPDAVVSVTPMYNPLLYSSVRLVNPDVVCVTIPTDFEQVKPRYWFNSIEQHYLNGTERLFAQAKAAGVADAFNRRISGMIIDPQCYEIPKVNVAQEIEKLGLDNSLPTGLVSFGGQGCILAYDIAKQLTKSHLKLNIIFLCGRNTNLFNELSRLETPYPKVVLGYIKQTPIDYLQLADFVIGKPGAMTITEAIITCTPMIIIKSRGMRPVERGNEEWVLKHGVGKIIDRVSNVSSAIKEVLNSSYRQNAANKHHRAVFEAAELVSSLVES